MHESTVGGRDTAPATTFRKLFKANERARVRHVRLPHDIVARLQKQNHLFDTLCDVVMSPPSSLTSSKFCEISCYTWKRASLMLILWFLMHIFYSWQLGSCTFRCLMSWSFRSQCKPLVDEEAKDIISRFSQSNFWVSRKLFSIRAHLYILSVQIEVSLGSSRFFSPPKWLANVLPTTQMRVRESIACLWVDIFVGIRGSHVCLLQSYSPQICGQTVLWWTNKRGERSTSHLVHKSSRVHNLNGQWGVCQKNLAFCGCPMWKTH